MKMKQVKEMTDAELDQKVEETRKEKFKMKAQAKSGQLENPAKVKALRKDLARMLTDKRRRETAPAAAK